MQYPAELSEPMLNPLTKVSANLSDTAIIINDNFTIAQGGWAATAEHLGTAATELLRTAAVTLDFHPEGFREEWVRKVYRDMETLAHSSSANVRAIFQVRVKAAAAFRAGAEKVGSLRYRVATVKFNLEHGLCSEDNAGQTVLVIHKELSHVYEKFQDLGERMGDLRDHLELVLQDIADLTESIEELSSSVFQEGLFIKKHQEQLEMEVADLRREGRVRGPLEVLPLQWCGMRPQSVDAECSLIEEELLEKKAERVRCREFKKAWDSCGDHMRKVEKAYSAIAAAEEVVCECVEGVKRAVKEASDCSAASLGFLRFTLEALEVLERALEDGARNLPMPKVHMHMLE